MSHKGILVLLYIVKGGRSTMEDCIEDWVTRAQAGDPLAFSEIVLHLQQKVFRYCYPMLGHRQDAEDVVQEVFVRAYKHLGKYRNHTNFTGWVLTIAHRLTMNKLRTNYRLVALFRKMASHSAQHIPFIDHSREEVLCMLDALSPKLREVVVLRIIHDMSYEEISRIVGTSSAALRKQFERARHQLELQHSNDYPSQLCRKESTL
jgi:RNA polymerase sigma-70 factor (ECF subfamily)